jgi:branched-chain amino acid transport system ATP-binding protein
VLEVKGLEAQYGRIVALRGVSLRVEEGEIVAVIGANGAGKTTLLRAISGLLKVKGQVRFEGLDITNRPADSISRLGLFHMPEGRGILRRMTVLENLEMGAFLRQDGDIAKDMERVFRRFPRLAERKGQSAATLSGGEQQMLAVGQAMMARPKLLMMDEPSLGLAPIVVADLFQTIRELREEGITILLVEQNAQQALECADRAYVFELGQVALEGTSAQLREDPRIYEAYLGAADQISEPSTPGVAAMTSPLFQRIQKRWAILGGNTGGSPSRER